jgi:hypothetical protein
MGIDSSQSARPRGRGSLFGGARFTAITAFGGYHSDDTGDDVSTERLSLGLVADQAYPISRVWAMPSPDTFSIPPIAAFIERWWAEPSVDPFARNSTLATYRNDLSPDTSAPSHMEAAAFCDKLWAGGGGIGLVLFDPPYSPRQLAEVYRSIGQAPGGWQDPATQNGRLYKEVRDSLDRLLDPGGIALSFGWNSAGFGKTRGYGVLEILLVAHGGAHNDTICVAERKR